MFCYIVLLHYIAVRCYTVLHRSTLYFSTLHCIMFYSITLCYILICCTILYCISCVFRISCIMFYHKMLYSTNILCYVLCSVYAMCYGAVLHIMGSWYFIVLQYVVSAMLWVFAMLCYVIPLSLKPPPEARSLSEPGN